MNLISFGYILFFVFILNLNFILCDSPKECEFIELKVESPNGGEVFWVGEDTYIRWSGISPETKVTIDYSFDSGQSWINLTKEATGLIYEWKNIPNPVSETCLVRIYYSISPENQKNPLEFEGHTGFIGAVVFNKAGTKLASASNDGTVRIWDVESQQLLRTLRGHNAGALNVFWSSDCQKVISGSYDSNAIVWDPYSGRGLTTLSGHQADVRCVTSSPDNNLIVTASGDKTIRVWDFENYNLKFTIDAHNSYVRHIDISPDSRYLISAGGDMVAKLWNLETGNFIREFRGHSDVIRSVVFNHNGTLIATASGDRNVKIWDVNTGLEIATLVGHTQIVQTVSFSPKGDLLASGSADNRIILWSTKDWSIVNTFDNNTAEVWNVNWSRDGTMIASSGMDRIIRVWRAKEPVENADLSDNFFAIRRKTDCLGNSFEYTSFMNDDNLTFVSDASVISPYIQLTRPSVYRRGAIWTKDVYDLSEGFTTSFVFSVQDGVNNNTNENSYPGADGFSFIIHPDNPEFIGKSGGGLGCQGIKNALIVEIDLFKNTEEYNDPNGNHIAVFVSKDEINLDHKSSHQFALNDSIIEIKGADQLYEVEINYSKQNKRIEIYLGKVNELIYKVFEINDFELQNQIDLLENGYTFLGISASTGDSYQRHIIHSWKLCVNSSATSVENSNNLSDRLFPNPTLNRFRIPIESDEIQGVSIIDINGSFINIDYYQSGGFIICDASLLHKGVYNVKLDLGNKFVVYKFIKE